MDKLVRRLVKRYKSNCPFHISKEMGIHVRYAHLGENTRGIYYRKLRRRFIVIHNQLSYEWQRFVCAHELGHDRLHRGISSFFMEEHSFFNPGKFERQANRFAVSLLLINEDFQQDETIEEICLRNGVPREMGQYYQ